MAHGPYGGPIGILKSIWSIMYVVWYYAPKHILKEFFTRKKVLELDMTRFKKRPDEVVIITGASRGVGAAAVKRFLELEMHVIAGVRNMELMKKVVADMRAGGVTTGKVEVIHLDLSSLASVRKFANEVNKTCQPLRALINNAGIMSAPYKLTEDGFESQFQINYLAPFLLTNLLLPQIKMAAAVSADADPGVVLDISSIAALKGSIDFDNLNGEIWYSQTQKYMDAKLAQACGSHYLGTKLKQRGVNVRVNALHPGMLGTDLWKTCWWYHGPLRWFFSVLTGTADDGADNILYAAFDPGAADLTGAFIYNRGPHPTLPQIETWETMERLWKLASELVKVSDFISQEPLEKKTETRESPGINPASAIHVPNLGILLHQFFLGPAATPTVSPMPNGHESVT